MLRLGLGTKNTWLRLETHRGLGENTGFVDMSPGPLKKTSKFDDTKIAGNISCWLKLWSGIWQRCYRLITLTPDLKLADKHPTWMWYNTFGCVLGL